MLSFPATRKAPLLTKEGWPIGRGGKSLLVEDPEYSLGERDDAKLRGVLLSLNSEFSTHK